MALKPLWFVRSVSGAPHVRLLCSACGAHAVGFHAERCEPVCEACA